MDLSSRYEDYRKLERVVKLKDEIIRNRATPAMGLRCDLKDFSLKSLDMRFDVVVIDPPWKEYWRRTGGLDVYGEDVTPWTFQEIASLKLEDVMAERCFVFLWVGETHLEEGRALFNKWNLRRIEDICWVKTNRTWKDCNPEEYVDRRNTNFLDNDSYFVRTKEHCLMGIRGTVRRSVDTNFIHANIDTDVIIGEEPESFGSTEKPAELYEIIEHFCLGRRRLELFGCDGNLRDGWVTLGRDITTSTWGAKTYASFFEGNEHTEQWPKCRNFRGGRLLGSDPVIEVLRPKSVEREREMQKVLKEEETKDEKQRLQREQEEDGERILAEDAGEQGDQFVDALDNLQDIPENLDEIVTRMASTVVLPGEQVNVEEGTGATKATSSSSTSKPNAEVLIFTSSTSKNPGAKMTTISSSSATSTTSANPSAVPSAPPPLFRKEDDPVTSKVSKLMSADSTTAPRGTVAAPKASPGGSADAAFADMIHMGEPESDEDDDDHGKGGGKMGGISSYHQHNNKFGHMKDGHLFKGGEFSSKMGGGKGGGLYQGEPYGMKPFGTPGGKIPPLMMSMDKSGGKMNPNMMFPGGAMKGYNHPPGMLYPGGSVVGASGPKGSGGAKDHTPEQGYNAFNTGAAGAPIVPPPGSAPPEHGPSGHPPAAGDANPTQDEDMNSNPPSIGPPPGVEQLASSTSSTLQPGGLSLLSSAKHGVSVVKGGSGGSSASSCSSTSGIPAGEGIGGPPSAPPGVLATSSSSMPPHHDGTSIESNKRPHSSSTEDQLHTATGVEQPVPKYSSSVTKMSTPIIPASVPPRPLGHETAASLSGPPINASPNTTTSLGGQMEQQNDGSTSKAAAVPPWKRLKKSNSSKESSTSQTASSAEETNKTVAAASFLVPPSAQNLMPTGMRPVQPGPGGSSSSSSSFPPQGNMSSNNKYDKKGSKYGSGGKNKMMKGGKNSKKGERGEDHFGSAEHHKGGGKNHNSMSKDSMGKDHTPQVVGGSLIPQVVGGGAPPGLSSSSSSSSAFPLNLPLGVNTSAGEGLASSKPPDAVVDPDDLTPAAKRMWDPNSAKKKAAGSAGDQLPLKMPSPDLMPPIIEFSRPPPPGGDLVNRPPPGDFVRPNRSSRTREGYGGDREGSGKGSRDHHGVGGGGKSRDNYNINRSGGGHAGHGGYRDRIDQYRDHGANRGGRDHLDRGGAGGDQHHGSSYTRSHGGKDAGGKRNNKGWDDKGHRDHRGGDRRDGGGGGKDWWGKEQKW
ncbi:unnamed protein product [Amoebophrya sp. A25]|nr:unnamed protein product [Amoebophrya sp. A25]|eukprot:GSA25T00013033001.1